MERYDRQNSGGNNVLPIPLSEMEVRIVQKME